MTPAELKRLSRPFAPEQVARARAIAPKYRLVIERSDEGGYIGSTVELPLVMGGGETIEECVRSVLEATVGAVATLLESGERPPAPAREGKRDQQVNIRLSSEERLVLESAARSEGFRSISDYIRTAALRGRRER